MRLATFDDHRLGVVLGDEIADVTDALPAEVLARRPADRMTALVESWTDLRGAVDARLDGRRPLTSVRLGPPLPRPRKILTVASNYREWDDVPPQRMLMGLKSPSSIVGPDATVELPDRPIRAFYPDAELAVVIGTAAKHVAVDDALHHVFGYTGAFDVSARGPGPASGIATDSFDTFGPLGPWIVTADELTDPQALRVRSWCGDEVRQDYSTAEMERTVAEVIAWASRLATLEPGDLVFCGTHHRGLGPMQGGDRWRMEIDGIGGLAISVDDPLGRRWPAGPDDGFFAAAHESRRTGAPIPTDAYAAQLPDGAGDGGTR